MSTDATVYYSDPRSPWQRGSNRSTLKTRSVGLLATTAPILIDDTDGAVLDSPDQAPLLRRNLEAILG
jgi:hypothetical protein